MAALGIRRNRLLTMISIAGIFHKTLGKAIGNVQLIQ